MPTWTNFDGLTIRYGLDRASQPNQGRAKDVEEFVTLSLDILNPPAGAADEDAPYIPAGAYITDAYLIVTEAFTGGTTVTIGLVEQDGTAIDADGIDAAVATAALVANRAVSCDGALVGGTVTVGADNAYLAVTTAGTYTAGKAKLVVKYINA